MGRRISKEFLHPSILEGVNDKIGNLNDLETDAKGNMVQAINELVDNLNRAPELEAELESARGEINELETEIGELEAELENMNTTMKKVKTGIHEHTYDGTTTISFEVSGLGFKPSLVQIYRANVTDPANGYVFWVKTTNMGDNVSVYFSLNSSDLLSSGYASISGAYKHSDMIAVNDDGFSLTITSGGTSGHLWNFVWLAME